MPFAKLLFWYNKFTVLIASILPWINLFKLEIDGNINFLKALLATAIKWNVAAEHAVIQIDADDI